jgi:hypothetical protein
MKRGQAPPESARAAARLRRRPFVQARRTLALLLGGALALAAAPLYLWLALNYSGALALAQTIPASEALRGFDFGPVYLKQGVRQRYFVNATIPAGTSAWHTSFEVLDSQRLAVFKQDELRFICDFQFAPGAVHRYAKAFTLARETGYYYFRFRALNGDYQTSPLAPPVVRFAIRQGVIDGLGLWLPVAALLLIGLLSLSQAWMAISRLGASAGADEPGAHEQEMQRIRSTTPRARGPRGGPARAS